MEKPSKRFTLNETDWKAIVRGAGVALGSALITYLIELLPSVDFGEMTPMVVAIAGILLNSGRKYLAGK